MGADKTTGSDSSNGRLKVKGEESTCRLVSSKPCVKRRSGSSRALREKSRARDATAAQSAARTLHCKEACRMLYCALLRAMKTKRKRKLKDKPRPSGKFARDGPFCGPGSVAKARTKWEKGFEHMRGGAGR